MIESGKSLSYSKNFCSVLEKVVRLQDQLPFLENNSQNRSGTSPPMEYFSASSHGFAQPFSRPPLPIMTEQSQSSYRQMPVSTD